MLCSLVCLHGCTTIAFSFWLNTLHSAHFTSDKSKHTTYHKVLFIFKTVLSYIFIHTLLRNETQFHPPVSKFTFWQWTVPSSSCFFVSCFLHHKKTFFKAPELNNKTYFITIITRSPPPHIQLLFSR